MECLNMDPHIYFVSLDFPSEKGKSCQRKWIKTWLKLMSVFLLMRSRFSFKSEISLSILQPFLFLVTTGHTQSLKVCQTSFDSLSFSYTHILIYKHCVVFQMSAMNLKVKMSCSLTRHWSLWKSQIWCDDPPLISTHSADLFLKTFSRRWYY